MGGGCGWRSVGRARGRRHHLGRCEQQGFGSSLRGGLCFQAMGGPDPCLSHSPPCRLLLVSLEHGRLLSLSGGVQ